MISNIKNMFTKTDEGRNKNKYKKKIIIREKRNTRGPWLWLLHAFANNYN